MAHLSTETLLDLVEGADDPRGAAHVATCVACREQIAALRATMVEVEAGAGGVPEPSPLFWDHLSARVRAAVADAPLPAPAPWWRITWQPAAMAMGVCAALVLAVLLGRSESPMPASPARAGEVAALTPPVIDVASDDSLDWLTDLASGVEWDDAPVLSWDVTDVAVSDLSDDERLELHRILQEALGGAGV